jgi:hypothetical protein
MATPRLEFIMRDSPVALIYDAPFAESAQALKPNLSRG